jgi:hypothetical protein
VVFLDYGSTAYLSLQIAETPCKSAPAPLAKIRTDAPKGGSQRNNGAQDSPPKPPTSTSLPLSIGRTASRSRFGNVLLLRIDEMEAISARSTFGALSRHHFSNHADDTEPARLKFDKPLLVSLYHGCTFRSSDAIRRGTKLFRGPGFAPHYLSELPALYMTNSPRYALMWATLMSLGMPLDSLFGAVFRVDVDMSMLPITFVPPAATVDFMRGNIARDPPIADPSVIVSSLYPKHVAQLGGPESDDFLQVAVCSEEAEDWVNAANIQVLSAFVNSGLGLI